MAVTIRKEGNCFCNTPVAPGDPERLTRDGAVAHQRCIMNKGNYREAIIEDTTKFLDRYLDPFTMRKFKESGSVLGDLRDARSYKKLIEAVTAALRIVLHTPHGNPKWRNARLNAFTRRMESRLFTDIPLVPRSKANGRLTH